MENKCPTIKELQKFPTIYTFKIIGNSDLDFTKEVYDIFGSKEDASYVERPSDNGKYLSISVTAEINDYEELESFYTKISKIKGLKFYV